MNTATILLLGLAGGLGAGARVVLDSLVRAWVRTALPVGTMVINITGSLLLGFLTVWCSDTGHRRPCSWFWAPDFWAVTRRSAQQVLKRSGSSSPAAPDSP